MTTFSETILQHKPKTVESIGSGKFGAQLATFANGWRAVLKSVSSGSDKSKKEAFRGIDLRTVPFREVAFYQLAKKLGWQDIVPETVLGSYKNELASFQVFVPSIHMRDLNKGIFNPDNKSRVHDLRKAAHTFPKDEWRRLVLLDLIANNRDRHGKNVIVTTPGPHLMAIDNSIAFGKSFARYRNVFHKHLFPKAFNFAPYRDELSRLKRSDFESMVGLLSKVEVDRMFLRTRFLLKFPYLIPFNVMSNGNDGINEFPPRKKFFAKNGRAFDIRPLVISPTANPGQIARLTTG